MPRFARLPLLFAIILGAGCATMQSEPQTAETAPPPSGPEQVAGSEPGTIPVGQQLDVTLQESLSSETAQVEQRFEATTAVDLMQGDQVLVPAGSSVRGVVSAVDKAGRVDRTGSLTLTFDQIVVGSREHPMRATATQVYESKGIREEVGTVGTAGAVGGIVGGIIGGLRGALLGAIVGSGGVIAATEGKDVTLPSGSIVRIRMDTPVEIR